jgi:hypothetical protein
MIICELESAASLFATIQYYNIYFIVDFGIAIASSYEICSEGLTQE